MLHSPTILGKEILISNWSNVRPSGTTLETTLLVEQNKLTSPFAPVGEPPLLTFQDYTTGPSHTGIVSIYNFSTSNYMLLFTVPDTFGGIGRLNLGCHNMNTLWCSKSEFFKFCLKILAIYSLFYSQPMLSWMLYHPKAFRNGSGFAPYTAVLFIFC
jgi:hypothetical protein